MLFNSYSFICFFAIILVFMSLPHPWRLKKTFLLLVSYVFYAAWNPPFVILLWISTVCDWYFAKWMARSPENKRRKLLLVGSLLVNLGMLAGFKYADFLMANFALVAQAAGFDYQPVSLGVVLPVGISFYTFQTLSYTIEIYRRKAQPWHSFLDYALYVTFFPQLVAGPIVRASHFLPQCEKAKRVKFEQVSWGSAMLVIGLFSKVIIADYLMAGIVEQVYSLKTVPGFFDAVAGTLAFAAQIFCDFSGYSTCAIGIALCLGFNLPRNFHFPYGAIGFSDFWQRWHISLSSWLKDYLYIPLGGNRWTWFKTSRNLMVTMLLGGLWHGASWNFVIWGGLHGLLLIVERLWKLLLPNPPISRNRVLSFIKAFTTFVCICIVWVFFRADTLPEAWIILQGIIGFNGSGTCLNWWAYAIPLGMFIFHWLAADESLESLVSKVPWWLGSLLIGAMLFFIFLCLGGEDHAFIYFQF